VVDLTGHEVQPVLTMIPPPPLVFNLTHTDRIRLVAVLQTERQYLTTLYQDPSLSEGPREFYGRRIADLQARINSLLTTLTQP